eukprot:1146449-Pelagomonas_calceolata.AAC.3
MQQYSATMQCLHYTQEGLHASSAWRMHDSLQKQVAGSIKADAIRKCKLQEGLTCWSPHVDGLPVVAPHTLASDPHLLQRLTYGLPPPTVAVAAAAGQQASLAGGRAAAAAAAAVAAARPACHGHLAAAAAAAVEVAAAAAVLLGAIKVGLEAADGDALVAVAAPAALAVAAVGAADALAAVPAVAAAAAAYVPAGSLPQGVAPAAAAAAAAPCWEGAAGAEWLEPVCTCCSVCPHVPA